MNQNPINQLRKFRIKLLNVGFVIFGLYPLIPGKFESLLVILFIMISFVGFVLGTDKTIKVNFKHLLIVLSPFLLLVLSLFYSSDLDLGLKKIGTMSSMILFPLIFILFYSNLDRRVIKEKLNLFGMTFVFSNFFYVLISIYFLLKFRHPNYSFFDSNFIRLGVSDIPFIGEHSIYLSVFMFVGILFGIKLFKEYSYNKFLRYSILVAILFEALFLIALMSKGVILASAITFFMIASKGVKIKFVSTLSFGLILFVFITPKENNRFYELFNKGTYVTLNELNSTSTRLNIYNCSLNSALQAPIIGYGIGDVQNVLDYCYLGLKLNFAKGLYNTHNQYLYFTLSTGFIGLVVFLLWIAYSFRSAVFLKNQVLFYVMFFYSIVFLFENLLNRQSGVILFSFLTNLLFMVNSYSISQLKR
ncbi:hypothetical protein KH5_08870 [Urechidicola sp. KH5]